MAVCLLLFIAGGSSTGHAFGDTSLFLGMGLTSANLMKVANSDSGEAGFPGTYYYDLNIKSRLGVNADWSFAPYLNYSLPRTSPEGGETMTLILLGLPFSTTFGNKAWSWNVGPGIQWYQIKGNGGTIMLPNGTTTAPFAQPSRTLMTSTMYVQGGVGFESDKIYAEADLFINGLLTARRSFGLLLTINYRVL